jgi:hypothetical protein
MIPPTARFPMLVGMFADVGVEPKPPLSYMHASTAFGASGGLLLSG